MEKYLSVPEFMKHVESEINLLKKYASSLELEQLTISMLDSQSSTHCIYGLMTSNCYSQRALELKELCSTVGFNIISDEGMTIKTFARSHKASDENFGKMFSPLECYIAMRGAKNAEIINYLQNKTSELSDVTPYMQ